MAEIFRPELVLAVSDLHLSPHHVNEEHDQAFADFVEARIEQPASSLLVLLGDLADLSGCTPQQLASSGRRVMDRHPRVVAALRGVLEGGATVALVAGNHDRAWNLPTTRIVLADRIAGSSDRLIFFPWYIHVPGLLYAEHGHLHHELNALRRPVDPYSVKDHPLGELIERYLDDRRRGSKVALMRFAAATVNHQARLASPVERLGRRQYRRLLSSQSAGFGALPGSILPDLDRLTTHGIMALPRRLVRKALARPRSPINAMLRRDDGYLEEAARRIHVLLAAHGEGVGACLFGHSHVPREVEIAPGKSYLNSGAWSEPRSSAFPFVEVTRAGACVRWWDQGVRGVRAAKS